MKTQTKLLAPTTQLEDYKWKLRGCSWFSKSATLEQVQKQDYKLTPGIYVGTEAEEDDGIPFEEKMEGLKSQLVEQFKKGEELKKEILNNFNRI